MCVECLYRALCLFIECLTTTFLRAHSWLNWVAELHVENRLFVSSGEYIIYIYIYRRCLLNINYERDNDLHILHVVGG